jgi:hypothetical protein
MQVLSCPPLRSRQFVRHLRQHNDDRHTGKVVGYRQCVDNVVRAVYEDARGQQYVVGVRGKVFGTWLLRVA